jgi:hypothetical protein
VSAAVDLRQSRNLGELTILDRKIERGVAETDLRAAPGAESVALTERNIAAREKGERPIR